jgi:hypothetical protein
MCTNRAAGAVAFEPETFIGQHKANPCAKCGSHGGDHAKCEALISVQPGPDVGLMFGADTRQRPSVSGTANACSLLAGHKPTFWWGALRCQFLGPVMSVDRYEIDTLWATLKEMGDVVGQAQAFNRANSYVLMEIVRDLARTQPDPHKYLAGMFERISARADQGAIEKEAHPVNAEFRDAVSSFFANAGKALNKQG